MLQSVRQFSSNQIPNLNGVLFWRRDLARWKHLNLSFFLIKSKLHSHCLQLWWKFQHLIHGNIAFEQQPNISYLRPWFLRRVLDHLKVIIPVTDNINTTPESHKMLPPIAKQPASVTNQHILFVSQIWTVSNLKVLNCD